MSPDQFEVVVESIRHFERAVSLGFLGICVNLFAILIVLMHRRS